MGARLPGHLCRRSRRRYATRLEPDHRPEEVLERLARQAAEVQDRVQLDRVRRDTRLAVAEVEEGDTGRSSAGLCGYDLQESDERRLVLLVERHSDENPD